MSPVNRTNPVVTGPDSAFGWDVMAGFYFVRAEAPGCTDPNAPGTPFVDTDILPVEPEWTGLLLELACVEENIPPNCSGAVASPDELWPPKHKFRDISVIDVTDPDGDAITITITAISQNEVLKGKGDGNTCPDANGVGTDTARVRAERSGRGDGRVYHLDFIANDGRGGQCAGTVTTCVPHDKRRGHVCVDQGPYSTPRSVTNPRLCACAEQGVRVVDFTKQSFYL